ncbi:DUF6665 family protein [Roseibium aquae]|uniref:DUF6665 family protein n=1 Tax=Roseibium aquae TaxID=1323746 RepID=UPI00123CE3DA|nr:DUF6665 family protein [Roseibium aquae]
MSVRPPKSTNTFSADPLASVLDQEILEQKVSTLTRLNKKLETALTRLRAYNPADPGDPQDETYDILLQEAGEAVWHVMIQRELCGFRTHTAFFDEMGVPKAVRLRAGLVTRPPKP